jgi:outer membrane protein
MKALRMFVIVFVVLASVCVAAPARAEVNAGFVKGFLSRYRPSRVTLPAPPSDVSSQSLAEHIRTGQLPLTMGDLINFILLNNLDIGVNRLAPLSSQYLIETNYRPFEPKLSLTATVSQNTSPATSFLVGAPSLTTLSGAYTASFSEALAVGGNLGVSLSVNRNSTNSSFAFFNPSYSGQVQYTFTQHLLNSFGRSINEHLIRIAKNNQKISESQFEQQVITLVNTAQKSYWDLVFSVEDIKVKQRSEDLAQKTYSDSQIQVNIGTLAPIDLIQPESDVATRHVQYVTSTYTQVQTQDQVKKLITSQGDPGLVPAQLIPLEGVRKPDPADILPVEQAIKIALENRPEMRQLQLDLENKKIDLQYTKNQLLPIVDFNASYTQNGVGGTQKIGGPSFFTQPPYPPLVIIPGGLADAFSQMFGFGYTGYSVGISATIPLSNRSAQGDNARSLTDERTAEQKITAQAQQIALDVRNALTQLEMNKAQIEATGKARELSERTLDAEQKKFDLGASTIRFVLEDQRNVAQAQTDELQALVNYAKALADLDKAMGMTLKKNNIEIEKTLNPGAKGR